VVIVSRCEAGSGGQKVDGGGRCEPDSARERQRAQAALLLFLVDPNCTLFGALMPKSAACRALTQRAVDLRLQITLPIGPGTLLLAAVTPRFVATTVSRILPLRQRESCQKLFFHLLTMLE
jgi:hypothetical protein